MKWGTDLSNKNKPSKTRPLQPESPHRLASSWPWTGVGDAAPAGSGWGGSGLQGLSSEIKVVVGSDGPQGGDPWSSGHGSDGPKGGVRWTPLGTDGRQHE